MAVQTRKKRASRPARKLLLKRIIAWLLGGVAAFYVLIAFLLFVLRWVNPPTTAVQAERHLEAMMHHQHYEKRYHFVPLPQISPHMTHAVISAEDARFYTHHGFDWKEMGAAMEQDIEGGRKRGASTLTQQLVRNLLLSTAPSLVRKVFEMSLVPLTEVILGKKRILELYLNVVEFGPGIYGCDAAARYYFTVPASKLSRDQAIKLAEVLPAPLHWRPGQKAQYGTRIALRMRQAGW